MPRFKLTIEYVGTRYSGWQVQQNARTVQGELRRAIAAVTGTNDFELYGAGRTDAGVHALRQVAHLDLRTLPPPDALGRRINDELPSDISVLAIENVPHRFHARHDAVARSYLYQVARRRTAFAKPFVWWVKDPLDVGLMRQAAALLEGMHDFRSFTDEDPATGSTLVKVERIELHESGDLLLIRVEGSHFLWKMVRRLIGVLVEAGRGRLQLGEVARFLQEKSGMPAKLTAPASGLFLEAVRYEGDCPTAGVIPVVNLTAVERRAPPSGAPAAPQGTRTGARKGATHRG
jgi:tRNA pseudouridine38-40 synthase